VVDKVVYIENGGTVDFYTRISLDKLIQAAEGVEAELNFDYITYSTPNTAARDLIEDEAIRNSTIAFPDTSILDRCETFQYLGTKYDKIYNELWREIKSK